MWQYHYTVFQEVSHVQIIVIISLKFYVWTFKLL